MPEEVVMPKLGLTMQEGKIVEWRKKEGEQVEKGEVLFIAETEKITYEVEATTTGVLGKIVVKEEETVPVGAVVAYLLLEGENVEVIQSLEPDSKVSTMEKVDVPANAEKIGDVEQLGVSPDKGRKVKASPAAKNIAKEHGLNIKEIEGTGPGGRIVKEDVLKAAKEKVSGVKEQVTAKTEDDVSETEIIKLTSMRRTIAKRMSESFYSAPHVFFTVEVDAGDLINLRKELIPFIENQTGLRLTITDILVKVVARVLQDYPQVNASWSDEGIKVFKYIHIGIATAVENGLLVPVVRDANKKTLAQICTERSDLTTRAKEGKVSMDDISGGTFTITNLGMYGIDFFTAIINPPESAILAVGATKEKAVVDNGEIQIRPIMCLTLSADHRTVDGVYAARFLQSVKTYLEKPVLAFQ